MSFVHVVAAMAFVIGLATVGTSAEGQLTREDYRLRAGMARVRAAQALVEQDACRVCLSTKAAHVDWRHFEYARVDRAAVSTAVDPLEVRVQVVLETDGDHVPVGRAQADFGDGTHSDWTGVVGARGITHRYTRPGRYQVRTVLQLPDGSHRTEEQSVDVPGGAV